MLFLRISGNLHSRSNVGVVPQFGVAVLRKHILPHTRIYRRVNRVTAPKAATCLSHQRHLNKASHCPYLTKRLPRQNFALSCARVQPIVTFCTSQL